MRRILARLLGAMIAAACLGTPGRAETPAAGRPLALEDITALEAFGRGAISPDGRWAVYEKRGPYDAIPRFEFEWRSTWAAMDLWLADLRRPDAPPVRLAPGEGPGLQRVAWSPSGARLLISKFRDGRLEYGVVSMADRSVVWTGLTPEVSRTGASAAWASDAALVLLVRPDHSLPAALRYQGASPGRYAEAWARTAEGRRPSRTVIEASGGVAVPEAAAPPRALVRLDPATGRSRVLREGRITDFEVSPDGRRVAVVEGGEGAPLTPERVVQFEGADRLRLSIRSLDGPDPASPEAGPIAGLDLATGLLRWSPDSTAVLAWARTDGAAWTGGGLFRIDAAGTTRMRLDGLTPGSAMDIALGVKADWIGNAPAARLRPAGGQRFDWYRLSPDAPPVNLTAAMETPPAQLAAAGEGALYGFASEGLWRLSATGARRLTPAGARLRPGVVGDQEQVLRLKANAAPRRAWTIALGPDGGTSVADADGGLRRLGDGAGAPDRLVAAGPEAAMFLRRTGLSEALVLRTSAGDRVLDVINADRADVRLIAPLPIDHADVRGRPARSWLYLPAAGTPVRGLIMQVYPGAADGAVWHDALSLTYGFGPQLPAARGYAVLRPSMPVDGPLASRGDDIVRGVDLAVDAALAACPQLPADRMAIMGHSFGGYAALEIATRSRRYRSYIAASAFTDMFGMWGELDPATRLLPEDGGMIRASQGWVEAGQGGLGAPPWAAVDDYAAASPYLSADRITAPVLLLTADFDFIPMSQSERMFSALLRNGGKARLVTYWGEHHNLWSPANIRDRYVQVFDWLDETLGPAVTPQAGGAAPRPGPSPRRPPPP
jgi:dipeptidyl aminopeptidase/acylaminoacyl peptidase